MSHTQQLAVEIQAPADPLVTRTLAILKDRVQQRCSTRVVEAGDEAQLVLAITDGLPPEAFRIDQIGGAVRVAGGSVQGLLYGVGKLLRTSRYDDVFVPSSWRGTSVPRGSLRGMYFASHFHNWYHEAPESEISRYLEDIALWGVNAIKVCFPYINLEGWDDPQAETAVAMVRKYARIAKDLGLLFGIGANNAVFRSAPQHLRAVRLLDPTRRRGNSGNPICPSNPEGHAYIVENIRPLFERLTDVGLDFVMYWPYDEGGCACDECRPWGSNGFLKLSQDLTRIAQEYYPELKVILSTWMYDTPPEGEWKGLSDALRRDVSWVDSILADSHEDFPRYPLDVGVPGGLPLLNFPEISMWGNWPWGGFGANPLPARFQRLWDQVKHAVEGGFPYSEGIYEDMNKAIVAQFYWHRDRSARSTLEEYIAYEYGPEVTRDVLAIIDGLESAASRSYVKQPVDTADVQRVYGLADAVNGRLPGWARQNWRWEILHLRAILDRARFTHEGLGTPEAEAAMVRLIEIYHCQMETDDPYHHRVRPPLQRAVSRYGEC
jgi:hypothetical protein